MLAHALSLPPRPVDGARMLGLTQLRSSRPHGRRQAVDSRHAIGFSNRAVSGMTQQNSQPVLDSTSGNTSHNVAEIHNFKIFISRLPIHFDRVE